MSGLLAGYSASATPTAPVAYQVTRPNQRHGQGDPLADITEQFIGNVEGTIARLSIMHQFIPVRSVRGTSTITSRGISSAKLQRITPGLTPAPSTEPNTSKIALTIDTVIIARNAEPMLDEFQTDFDYQREVAREQGQAHSNMYDETFFIVGAKAAQMTDSPYGTSVQMPGHKGGNVVKLANVADSKDPAKMYAAISELVTKFLEKDVDPSQEDMIVVVPPHVFTALQQSEYIVNGNYVTAAGKELKDTYQFRAWGMPVKVSNNAVFGKKIEGHLLSNDRNQNMYDGDFTDVVCQILSPRAFLAGVTIPLTAKIFFDDLSKLWFIDSWTSFGATVNRPEFAGVVTIPKE